jgi:hypothetical protein
VWLASIYGRDRRLRLKDDEFRNAMRMRMDAPLLADPGPTKCRCGKNIGGNCEVLMRCTSDSAMAQRTLRHHRVKYAAMQLFKKEENVVEVQKEVDMNRMFQQRAPVQKQGKGDLLVRYTPVTPPEADPLPERAMMLDVSIAHPFAAQSLNSIKNKSEVRSGFAADVKAREKVEFYSKTYQVDYRFKPFVIETYGTWGRDALAAMDQLYMKPEQYYPSEKSKRPDQRRRLAAIRVIAAAVQRANFLVVLVTTNPLDRRLRVTNEGEAAAAPQHGAPLAPLGAGAALAGHA